MTQNELVLDYMREHGSISQKEAVNELGCYRLSARIHDLREDGHKITATMKSFTGRTGKGGYYAEYSLEE